MKLTKKIIDGIELYFENDVKKYTHSKDKRDGYEWWREHDSNNNVTHFENNQGYEWLKEYDSNNNEIYHKNSEGVERWSDNYPNHLKNKVVDVDIEPFTFSKK